MSDLLPLLEPRSIALIGASPDASKLAGRPLAYLKRYGFQGQIHLVNPKYEAIDGHPCVARVEDLPEAVDLALLLLPASAVAEALEACGRRGIRAAISIAGGFAEAGLSDEQDRLTRLCAEWGIRLVGPNCVGALHPALGMTATFSSELKNRMPRPGHLALFTQSGALGNALLQSFNQLDVGLAYWVSTGNEADIGVLDLVEHGLNDSQVEVIALYIEGLKDAQRLVSLGKRARETGKAILVLRAGQSQLGRAAAVSHTGKLAGAWRVWRDVADQAGLIGVNTLDEMLDLIICLEALGTPSSEEQQGLGVLTISGGMGVLMSDGAAQYGLPLPPFATQTQEALRQWLPPQMSVANPVDTALFTNEKGFSGCAQAVLHDPQIGVLLIVLTSLAHDYASLVPFLERLSRSARALNKGLAISYLSSSDGLNREQQQRLQAAGALMLPSPQRLVNALGQRRRLRQVLAPQAPQALPTGTRTPAEFLRAADVPELPTATFTAVDDAVRFAQSHGYPVVLKVVSADIPHKTEAGGVALDLRDESSLRQAWQQMVARVTAYAPQARIDGYAVQPMVTGSFELIVGCSVDPEIGRVLMVGAGGVWAEVLDDVRFLSLPASREDIRAALEQLRIAPILAGARGRAALDVEAAVDTIDRLSQQFCVDRWVTEVDINPLSVREVGQGVMAMDTLVLPPQG